MPGIPGPLIVSARHILDRIDRIDQALKPRNARVGIAAIMLSAAQKAFATEEFGGNPGLCAIHSRQDRSSTKLLPCIA